MVALLTTLALACTPDSINVGDTDSGGTSDTTSSTGPAGTIGTDEGSASSGTEGSGSTTESVPTTDGSTTEDAPLTGGSTTDDVGSVCLEEHLATDDCCCFTRVIEDFGGTSTIHNSCLVSDVKCPNVETTCEIEPAMGICPDDLVGVDDSQTGAISCVLGVLRDGAPARVSWSFDFGGGFAGNSAVVSIVGDQTVFQIRTWYEDASSHARQPERYTLPPPAFFDDCEAMATALDRYKCMISFMSGRPLETCDPPEIEVSE